jgi:hypothetical protein
MRLASRGAHFVFTSDMVSLPGFRRETAPAARLVRWKDDTAPAVDSSFRGGGDGLSQSASIQHDFGFPRFVNPAEAEVSALNFLCIVVSAANRAALELMREYPKHATMCQAIADFATDGESDIHGTIAALENGQRRRPYRGWVT